MRVIQNAAAAWSDPFRSSMKGKLFIDTKTLMRISKKVLCINYSDLDQACSAPKMDLPYLHEQVTPQTPSPRAISKTPRCVKETILRLPSDSITLLDSKPSHSKLGDQLLVSMNPKS